MAEDFCVTFLWKIENFSFCRHQQFDSYLDSPEFYVHHMNSSLWELRIHPYRFESENEVKVHLHNNFHKRKTLLIDYEISFLDADGSVLFTGKTVNNKITADKSYGISNYPTVQQVFKNRRDAFLPQDTLTIQCRLWNCKRGLPCSFQYIARTHIAVEHRYVHWTVMEFSELPLSENTKSLRVVSREGEPTYLLDIFIEGGSYNEADVSFYITRISESISKKFLKCKISVIDVNGNAVKCKEGLYQFTKLNSTWEFPRFLTRNELVARKDECLVDDVLHLVCDLAVKTDVVHHDLQIISSVPPWIQMTNDLSNTAKGSSQGDNALYSVSESDKSPSSVDLESNLLCLYKERTLSDFEFRCEDKSFPVHKCVLAARSPVFKAMFMSKMKEDTSNILTVPDMDADILDQLLQFIYTGIVADLRYGNAFELYNAAVKYELPLLKGKCSAILADNITIDNMCSLLTLANTHQDQVLKSAVHIFIVENDAKVIHSTQWMAFMKADSQLASETMYLLYKSKMNTQRE